MADKYWVSTSNKSSLFTASNKWADTAGGAAGASTPVAGDVCHFQQPYKGVVFTGQPIPTDYTNQSQYISVYAYGLWEEDMKWTAVACGCDDLRFYAGADWTHHPGVFHIYSRIHHTEDAINSTGTDISFNILQFDGPSAIFYDHPSNSFANIQVDTWRVSTGASLTMTGKLEPKLGGTSWEVNGDLVIDGSSSTECKLIANTSSTDYGFYLASGCTASATNNGYATIESSASSGRTKSSISTINGDGVKIDGDVTCPLKVTYHPEADYSLDVWGSGSIDTLSLYSNWNLSPSAAAGTVDLTGGLSIHNFLVGNGISLLYQRFEFLTTGDVGPTFTGDVILNNWSAPVTAAAARTAAESQSSQLAEAKIQPTWGDAVTLSPTGDQVFSWYSTNGLTVPLIIDPDATGTVTLIKDLTVPYIRDCGNKLDTNGYTVTETSTDPETCPPTGPTTKIGGGGGTTTEHRNKTISHERGTWRL